jgi:uncharacterized membrane protein
VRKREALVLAAFLAGCSQKPVSYQAQIQPILNNRCIQCHSTGQASDGIVLTSYDSVMSSVATQHHKPIVVPGDASGSQLYVVSESDQLHFRMPPDTAKMLPIPKDEVLLIGRWIQQGAKNN